MLYEATQNIMLGRNVADILEYIKNPVNESVLDLLLAKVEDTWTK